MSVYASLFFALLFYIPFFYLAVRYKSKTLCIKLLTGVVVALITAYFCYHNQTIWVLQQRTWYWAVVCGFATSALPYISFLLFLSQFAEYKRTNRHEA